MSDDAGTTRAVYSIGAVARMLAIPVATLRNWEDRYGAVVPERSPGGHRLYSREQVEQLRFVAAEVAGGRSAADAHRLLADHNATRRPLVHAAPSTGPRFRVLVAERSPVTADLEQFFLRSEGYEVRVASTVGEAEEQWLETRPQLAIVELMISGGMGVELCRRLKRHDGGAVLAVSVLQAGDEALAAGADAFLQKPLDRVELVSVVKELLEATSPVDPRMEEPS